MPADTALLPGATRDLARFASTLCYEDIPRMAKILDLVRGREGLDTTRELIDRVAARVVHTPHTPPGTRPHE